MFEFAQHRDKLTFVRHRIHLSPVHKDSSKLLKPSLGLRPTNTYSMYIISVLQEQVTFKCTLLLYQ